MLSGTVWVAFTLTLVCTSASLVMAAGHRASSLRAIAHAAHELRGALFAADLCLTSMSRSYDEPVDLPRWVQDMGAQLERAAWAADDLDRLRGVRVAALVGPIELSALVRRRVRAWTRLAALSEVDLSLEWAAGTVCVDGDARSLCQALDNLVSNAIAHGEGDVHIRAERNSRIVRLRIDDGGPGPKSSAVARLGSLSARHGHGLAIARRAVERCGGELDLARRGVVVELPLRSTGVGMPVSLGGGAGRAQIGDRAPSAA